MVILRLDASLRTTVERCWNNQAVTLNRLQPLIFSFPYVLNFECFFAPVDNPDDDGTYGYNQSRTGKRK